MKVVNHINSILPRYSVKWFVILAVSHFLTYYLGMVIGALSVPVRLTMGLDDLIPFCPEFVVVYVLAFPYWIVNAVLAFRESRKRCLKTAVALVLCYAVCFAFYCFFPTTLTRPEVNVTDFFSWVASIIYSMDRPVNLFPSLHCVLSWLCCRIVLKNPCVPVWYRIFGIIFAIAVCASTVLIKQHVTADVISGVVLAEISLLLSPLILKLFNRENH